MFALKKVIEKKLKMTFTQHILANIGFTGKKLSTYLQIKDQPKFEDKHDIVYLGTCPEGNCSENYIVASAAELPKEQLIITLEIRTHKFSNIAVKNATNTFKLAILK